LQSSYPIWEDFNSKATKLHSQLRTTVLAAVAFLDAFQKVADMATNTRGGTRDIGSALTRMCMRHRSIEAKLRQFTNALMESLINPLQDRIEDWKKTANQLDKDHAKVWGRWRGVGAPWVLMLPLFWRQNGELTMLGEITHLQGIIEDLVVLTAEPHKLPPASEQVIKDLKGSDYSWSYQTPPSSPSSSSSRKSSMCRYVGVGGGAPYLTLPGNPSLTPGARANDGPRGCSPGARQPPHVNTANWSPVMWRNWSWRMGMGAGSGLVGLRGLARAPPSGFGGRCKGLGGGRSVPFAVCPAKDGPRASVSPEKWWVLGEGSPKKGTRVVTVPPLPPQHGEEVSPAASDLAMVLTRGLSLEHQKSSRDSLQYSSGYSTQTTTPSCSEDTIPSQGSDYDCYSVNGDVECDPQSDFDKSSTIPRNSNIAQNYRRMIQTKRPASTAGLPTGTNLPTGTTPGVATIRRTPSTKPSVRRTLSNAGPLPIRP
ncbi:MTSS1-like, partial [Charadrius vociferus]